MRRSHSAKVGAFMVTAVVLLMAVLILFADWRFWRQRQDYSVRFPYSVSGLSVGSRVELWGVHIGDVNSIAIDGDRIAVGLRVESEVSIPKDAQAALKFEGLTGLKYIDIEHGDLEGAMLARGGEIRPAPGGLSQVVDEAIKVVYHLDDSLSKVDALVVDIGTLVGPANRERVTRILEDATKTMAKANTLSDDLIVVARAARRQGPALLQSLAQTAVHAERIAGQGIAVTKDLAAAVRDGRRAAHELATLTDHTGNYLLTALQEIRATAASARGWIRSLEASPSRILFGSTAKELPPP